MSEWKDRIIGYHCDDVESFEKLNLIQKIHLAHLFIKSGEYGNYSSLFHNNDILECFDHLTGGNDEFSIRSMYHEIGRLIVEEMLKDVKDMLPWDEVVDEFLDETDEDMISYGLTIKTDEAE